MPLSMNPGMIIPTGISETENLFKDGFFEKKLFFQYKKGLLFCENDL